MAKSTWELVSVQMADEQRVRMAELRLLGKTYAQIGAELGLSADHVGKTLREMDRPKRIRSYDEYAREALERCELLLSKLEPGIMAGDPRSIDSATKLVDRIAKLLGLDHRDRMNERAVRVEEAKIRLVGEAVAEMLDHLEVVGDRRTEAIAVLQTALERQASM